ncbi:MAG: MFS transporter [Luteibaculaceae bacterium]
MAVEELEEKVYEFITDDSELRACDSIPDSACNNAPKNFSLNVLNGSATKLAEQIINPGVTLPWIMSAIGAPVYLNGALVPIKDAGSLLPQLFVSAKIRAFAIRKNFWAYSALLQAVCMLLMGFLVFLDNGTLAGWLMIVGLLIFSMASGVASIAFKDVVAKTIPKQNRAKMLAARASLGGVFSLAAGLLLYFFIGEDADTWVYFSLFLIAAVLWVVSAFLFFGIKEDKGYTDGGRNPIDEVKKGVNLLQQDKNLTRFVITRALLMAIPLAMPFYVLLGKNEISNSLSAFGLLIVTNGAANILSSPFWGKFSDKSSRAMMIVTAGLGIFTALYAVSVYYWPEEWKTMYAFLPILFLNGMAHAGARLSRKTYLINFAPKEERPLYVSLSNTLIGLFTVVAAGLGFVAELFNMQAQILFFAAMLVLSIVFSLRLKEV